MCAITPRPAGKAGRSPSSSDKDPRPKENSAIKGRAPVIGIGIRIVIIRRSVIGGRRRISRTARPHSWRRRLIIGGLNRPERLRRFRGGDGDGLLDAEGQDRFGRDDGWLAAREEHAERGGGESGARTPCGSRAPGRGRAP